MSQRTPIKGFSKLSKQGKIEWLINEYFEGKPEAHDVLSTYLHEDPKRQRLHDDFIENTITNYYLPFGVAPNFLINDELYALPMAIEESSVVAAASKAANFWLERGGFKTTILSTKKIGHVHFMFTGDTGKLEAFFSNGFKDKLRRDTDTITANMRARGGGIIDMKLVDKTNDLDDYFQIEATFETCDSMGANFINSCLEQFAKTLKAEIEVAESFTAKEKEIQIVMCILSNYTPECIVRAEVSCPIEDLVDGNAITPNEFATKFHRAVRIAEIDPYRATTHNKGIFNGIDAVIIATGNDFRAIEAAGHTYASRKGQYESLTHCSIDDGVFRFWIETPMALGTIGGLTGLHPMVKFAHKMLGQPNAEELMGIVAASGLAQNFAALRALTTTGIQKGHMKMHLFNILNQLEATDQERKTMVSFFADKIPHHAEVINKFCEIRGIENPKEIYNKK